jgi:hypothetical protein
MVSEIVYEDLHGEVIDRGDFVEIRWFDATSELDSEGFNAWLALFAGIVEERRRRGVLVDGLAFLMDPAHMDGEWRDANIIPRYNAAGVRRFAFVMPAGMPAIGAAPAPEGPGDFPTGYFGRREDAIAWLAAD